MFKNGDKLIEKSTGKIWKVTGIGWNSYFIKEDKKYAREHRFATSYVEFNYERENNEEKTT